MTKFTHF